MIENLSHFVFFETGLPTLCIGEVGWQCGGGLNQCERPFKFSRSGLTDEIKQSAGSKLGNGTSLNNKGYSGLCSQLLWS